MHLHNGYARILTKFSLRNRQRHPSMSSLISMGSDVNFHKVAVGEVNLRNKRKPVPNHHVYIAPTTHATCVT